MTKYTQTDDIISQHGCLSCVRLTGGESGTLWGWFPLLGRTNGLGPLAFIRRLWLPGLCAGDPFGCWGIPMFIWWALVGDRLAGLLL